MKNMTRKEYVAPRVRTTEVEPCQMMAASDPTAPKARTQKLEEETEEFSWDE